MKPPVPLQGSVAICALDQSVIREEGWLEAQGEQCIPGGVRAARYPSLMALSIDSTRPVKGPAARQALVAAVHGAQDHNEYDWIEWKLRLALGKAEGNFALAKQILGMANRDPDRAAQNVAGHGYVLVGIQPGDVRGIDPIDPADLESWINKYVGQDGPGWDLHWVTYQNVGVLLIQVDPPQWGDLIHTLRKEYEGCQEGAVLVRSRGGVHQASTIEMQMLQRRCQKRTEVVDVVVEVDPDSEALPVRFDASWIGERVEADRNRFLSPLAEPEEQQQAHEVESGKEDTDAADYGSAPSVALRVSPQLQDQMHQMQQTMAMHREQFRRMTELLGRHPVLGRETEDRDPEEYREQVEQYLRELHGVLPIHAFVQWMEEGLGRVQIDLVNPTERNLAEVQLELFFEQPAMAFEEPKDLDAPPIPQPPRRWGSPVSSTLAASSMLAASSPLPHALDTRFPMLGFNSIEIDNSGSARLTFDSVALRPLSRVSLPAFYLLTTVEAGTVLTGKWRATASNADGVVKDVIHLPVGEEAAPPDNLTDPNSS